MLALMGGVTGVFAAVDLVRVQSGDAVAFSVFLAIPVVAVCLACVAWGGVLRGSRVAAGALTASNGALLTLDLGLILNGAPAHDEAVKILLALIASACAAWLADARIRDTDVRVSADRHDEILARIEALSPPPADDRLSPQVQVRVTGPGRVGVTPDARPAMRSLRRKS